jgi:uncharacterized protein (TIGR02391 family)
LLRRQLDQARETLSWRHDDARIDAWESTTRSILDAAFGKPNDKTAEFSNAGGIHYSYEGMPDSEYQERYRAGQLRRAALLQGYIDQLQILEPSAPVAAPGQYKLHPEVEKVSGRLFRDGHYKQAALEAYIRLINEVKVRSGLQEDGDPLMNRAFGFQNQVPQVRFNSLQTDPEKDEQKGLMFLYKGVVGLRNSDAHSNRLFDDPSRAFEYLALASLLMRLLEIAYYDRAAE